WTTRPFHRYVEVIPFTAFTHAASRRSTSAAAIRCASAAPPHVVRTGSTPPDVAPEPAVSATLSTGTLFAEPDTGTMNVETPPSTSKARRAPLDEHSFRGRRLPCTGSRG